MLPAQSGSKSRQIIPKKIQPYKQILVGMQIEATVCKDKWFTGLGTKLQQDKKDS